MTAERRGAGESATPRALLARYVFYSCPATFMSQTIEWNSKGSLDRTLLLANSNRIPTPPGAQGRYVSSMLVDRVPEATRLRHFSARAEATWVPRR